ncbi:hypothetical protein AB3N59_03945 [Leptospira sp. WS92.C1]
MKLDKTVLFFITLFFTFSLYAQPLNKEQERLVAIVHTIVEDLETLVLKTPINEKDEVYLLLKETIGRLKTGTLKIGVREELERDIFGSAVFSLRSEKTPDPSIDLSPYLLDLYQTRPSIVLSAFVHECQHSKSYFDDPERFLSLGTTSTLEKYLYELDSYNRESQFILKYLKKNKKYKLTHFEILLSTSFEKDNLEYFSYVALGHDLSLAAYLYNLPNSKLSYEEKLKLLEKTLDQILSVSLNDKADPWNQYMQVVPMYSFLQFAPQSIRNIDTIHEKIPDQSDYDLPKRHPILYDRLLVLEKIFTDNIQKYKYLQMTLDKLRQID